jgi:two-component system, sensor histidine kinase YesM
VEIIDNRARQGEMGTMHTIRYFYRNYMKQRLFNKILVIYMLITICSLMVLSFFIYSHYETTIMENEMNANSQKVQMVSSYMNEKYQRVQNIMEEVYNDPSLMQDFMLFLRLDYDFYIKNRLDRYIEKAGAPTFRMQTAELFLKSLQEREPDIQNMILYSTEQQFFYFYEGRNMQLFKKDQIGSDKKEALSKLRGSSFSYNEVAWDDLSVPAASHEINKSEHIYSIIKDINDPNSLKHLGLLVFSFNAEKIMQAYSKSDNDKGYILIANNDGEVIFDSSGKYSGQKYPYMKELVSNNDWVNLDEPSKVEISLSGAKGLIVAGIMPKSELSGELGSIKKVVILITALCIMIAFAATFFVMRRFSKRVNIIMEGIFQVRRGDLSVRIPLKGEDELQLIAHSFNDMVEKLNLYIDRVYRSELKQKDAELIAFQSQINPHFLYNTLEAIRMRALSQGARDVGDMIYILATLFRNSVKKKTIVTMEDEIQHCKIYLDLFRIRYQNRLDYDIDIPDELLQYRLIKLLIQPVIENYVVHGFLPERDDNLICISARLYDDTIQIEVRDNGSGIEPNRLHQLRKGLLETDHSRNDEPASIGLRNVHERIQIFYGIQYGVDIDSMIGEGTSVTITIPAVREMDNLA